MSQVCWGNDKGMGQGMNMTGKKLTALAAAALMALSTISASGAVVATPPAHHTTVAKVAVWSIFGCAGDIIAAAWVAHVRFNRQLTANEAMTCGIGFWLNPAPAKPRRR